MKSKKTRTQVIELGRKKKVYRILIYEMDGGQKVATGSRSITIYDNNHKLDLNKIKKKIMGLWR